VDDSEILHFSILPHKSEINKTIIT